jgi:hypothetical protein
MGSGECQPILGKPASHALLLRRIWSCMEVYGTESTMEKSVRAMNQQESVTDFRLTANGKPVALSELLHALNCYLKSVGCQPEEYGFKPTPGAGPDLPQRYRWLVAFVVEGESEGYYIHLVAIPRAACTFTDLGLAKTWTTDSAYAIARETQRFLTASLWN